jgi:hypothetical protein
MSRARYTDALSFSCPTCHARAGQYCAIGCEADRAADKVHATRVRLVPVRVDRSGRSVQAVPTAVETNRRKH